MDIEFLKIVISGSIKDPILWIISFIIGSRIILKINIKLINLYLCLSGIIWGFIRVYIYNALGEELLINQVSLIILTCLLFMVLLGNFFSFINYYFKTNS